MQEYSSTVEAELKVPGITFQVSSYDWAPSVETTECLSEYTIALLLSPRHAYSQGYYLVGDIAGPYLDIGMMMLAPADIPLKARTSGGPIRVIRCCFERDKFKALTGLDDRWSLATLRACLNIRDARLQEGLMRLARETLSPGIGSAVMAEGLGMSTAVELARHIRGVESRAETVGGLVPWQLRRIVSYIDNASGAQPEISELAALCGISCRHLRRLFKQTMNQTIHEYMRDVWVRKAISLLCETDMALKQISAHLGFTDASGFSMAFRRATGESPRCFRQQFAKSSGEPRLQ